jgi:hypothetical protein
MHSRVAVLVGSNSANQAANASTQSRRARLDQELRRVRGALSSGQIMTGVFTEPNRTVNTIFSTGPTGRPRADTRSSLGSQLPPAQCQQPRSARSRTLGHRIDAESRRALLPDRPMRSSLRAHGTTFGEVAFPVTFGVLGPPHAGADVQTKQVSQHRGGHVSGEAESTRCCAHHGRRFRAV